jgi:ATP-dependent DNA ligase
MAKQPRFAGVEYPIRPMAAVPADALPDDQPGIWALETKLDGWRCLAMYDRGRVVLQSRQQRPLSRYFPEVVAAVRELGVDAVFDGELVAWTDGHLDFAALQQRLHPGVAWARRLAVTRPARFVVFNLLARNEGDLRARRTAGVAARWRCCLSPPAGSDDDDADARLSHQPMATARPPFPTPVV